MQPISGDLGHDLSLEDHWICHMTFCRVHLIDDIFAGCIEFPSLDGFVDSCLFDNYLDTERMGKEYEITSSNQTRRWKSPHTYVYIYIEGERERGCSF
jgi:hypothetical protein